jgi:hypothetical protein
MNQPSERDVVEDRRDRPEDEHEALDCMDVPVRRDGLHIGIDGVSGDGGLRGVVDQVVEQDLARRHRQERQQQCRSGHAQHVPEV